MAVISDLTKVSVVAKLNNGTKDGKVQTLGLSLGDLNIESYDDQKAMNVVNLLKPCLNKDVYEVQKVAVSVLKDAE
ncbi:MAG: hypothetical protein IJ597_06850 [Synergistaceae bacterium]|nr:hypothetical protein [Synergistaceae bacterium]